MINTAMVLGRVGKKDSKPLKNGSDMTTLSIATIKKYKDSTGQSQEQTTWHNVSCFNKLSEIASKYVHVGDLVCIQGEIQHKKIENGERAGQYRYSINANDIKFIPKGNKADSESKQNTTKATPRAPFEDDDLPFF